MRLLPHRREEHAVPADPLAWRPQQFGRRRAQQLDDPLVEPLWDGLRVIVHASARAVEIRDEEGVECSAEFAAVRDAIGEALAADEIILDGYLTVQATQASSGVSLSGLAPPTQGDLLRTNLIGRAQMRETPPRPVDRERPIALVAVDLLQIDGLSLLEVPLQERKRLLESGLQQTDLVRITTFTRPPLGSLLLSLHSLGFTMLAYKEANSRYVPGATNEGWSTIRIPKP